MDLNRTIFFTYRNSVTNATLFKNSSTLLEKPLGNPYRKHIPQHKANFLPVLFGWPCVCIGFGLVISQRTQTHCRVIDNIPASNPRWTFNAAVSVCQRGRYMYGYRYGHGVGMETNTSPRKMYLSSSLVAHVRGKRVAGEGGPPPVCQSAYLSGATKCKASKNLGQIAVTVFIFRRLSLSFPLTLSLCLFHLASFTSSCCFYCGCIYGRCWYIHTYGAFPFISPCHSL